MFKNTREAMSFEEAQSQSQFPEDHKAADEMPFDENLFSLQLKADDLRALFYRHRKYDRGLRQGLEPPMHLPPGARVMEDVHISLVDDKIKTWTRKFKLVLCSVKTLRQDDAGIFRKMLDDDLRECNVTGPDRQAVSGMLESWTRGEHARFRYIMSFISVYAYV